MRWFLRVRWAAVIAELIVVGAAVALGETLPIGPMLALIAGQAISNAIMHPQPPATESGRTLILTLDVAVLFALLALSGGPSNPFSALFFVQVTLAAVLLSRAATAFVWLSSVVAYGALFAIAPDAHQHGGGFATHLYGMFAAFALTSALIAYFVHRLSRALRDARVREAHARRVASLTTFAAGAAHELGTPLGTITLVAGELADRIADDDVRDDLAVIRQQTARCRQILDSIHARAGGVAGEGMSVVTFDELVESIRERIGEQRSARLDASGKGRFEAPKLAFLQVVENLVSNAFDASGEEARVSLSFEDGVLRVRDRGSGMDAETLARVTEPYFTTKPEGEGTGLGLFVAAETIHAVGGSLELESVPNQGTTAIVRMPMRSAT